ncbi:MAG: hypothetical protein GY842_10575 [bacterium]|nr:hypothetical protein [bacterium]
MAMNLSCGRWMILGVAVVLAPAPLWGDPPEQKLAQTEGENWLGQIIAAQPADSAQGDEAPMIGAAHPPDSAGDAATAAPGPSLGGRLEGDVIEVSKAGQVELHVAERPLPTVLEILSVESQRNIIATPNVTGTVTAHLYNVTFEEALDAILVANQAGYREVGNFIYVYTNEELAAIIAAETPPATRVIPLYYIPAVDALAIVTPMLSDVGTAVATPDTETGLSSDSEQAGGNSLAQQDYLVVRDRPDVIAHILKTLLEVDVRPRQVLVEATILGVRLDDRNSLGVDFTVVGGVDLELIGSTSTAVTNLTMGQLPTNRLEKWNSNVSTDFTDMVDDGGMTIGVIKDHVGVFIRALESITDTIVLANPKVLALNKQKAQVIVGRRDGYLTTTVTETQAIQTVEFLETGTQLIFRPFIGRDGYVRMELHPEDSVGTVQAGLPSEQTTELTTNVMIQDGQTVLIGGLFREVATEGRSQVPLLGDIPVAGTAFQGRNDSTERQEVVILLTVHIVKDDDAYAQAGEEIRQDMERMRVGLRRQMMWNGRERLAQAHYRKALEHFAAGDTPRAMWDVRMALYNYPRFTSAIDLKEEILGHRDWDDEGSTTRDFIYRIIAKEQGIDGPDYERLGPPFVRPDELIDSDVGESNHES